MKFLTLILAVFGVIWFARTAYARRHLRWKLHAAVTLLTRFLGNVREIAHWEPPLVVPLKVAGEVMELLVGLLIWALAPLFLLFLYGLGLFLFWFYLLAGESDIRAMRRWLKGKPGRAAIHRDATPDLDTKHKPCVSVASVSFCLFPAVSVRRDRAEQTKRARPSPRLIRS